MISSRAVGRCTFTTTRSPVSRRAACTCAIVPAASGSGSISAKTSSHGTRSSSSMTATTSASGSGWTRSWRDASSSTTSGGRRSGRVESTWPSFAKVGPSSSIAARSRRARSRVDASERRSSSPCFASTRAMRVARPRSGPSTVTARRPRC